MGHNGELRRYIQEQFPVRIVDRGAKVVVLGDQHDAQAVGDLLNSLLDVIRRGHTPTLDDVQYAVAEARAEEEGPRDESEPSLGEVLAEAPAVIRRDIGIKPRTHGQKQYLDTIAQCDLTFVIGPAGTGKTYLAMAAAVSALLSKQVQRLVLTRPAVEAGESLGFLPGDLEQKVNPYLRPLYDALYSMVELGRVQRFLEQQRIEVAPLAFMRGRTLDHAFVILDEAQNTTPDQMKMFLTRLGQGSRAVVTGDVTQRDLPRGAKSGLEEAVRILGDIPELGVVHLTRRDVVRNPLVQRIINAYDAEKAREDSASAPRDAAE